jgi:hypothetical protein
MVHGYSLCAETLADFAEAQNTKAQKRYKVRKFRKLQDRGERIDVGLLASTLRAFRYARSPKYLLAFCRTYGSHKLSAEAIEKAP